MPAATPPPNSVRRSSAPLAAVLLAALCWAGCAVTDYVGAYFNTYYNASRAFDEAEDQVLTARTPAQIENPLLAPYTVPNEARNKFIGVVEKCSKLLQYHPASSLVDNSLMLIGKSYYYQADYQRAERKFRELIEGYPESGLAAEARVLQAECYYRMSNRETAGKLAKELAAAPDVEPFALNRAALLQAQIALDRNDQREAVGFLKTAAESAPDAGARTIAYRRLGEVQLAVGDPDAAFDAFQQAYAAAGDYVTEYRARFGQVRALDAAGRRDDALALLDDLLDNQNNREFFPELDLQYATTLQAMGRYDEAIEQYRFVDTAYARTEQSAMSYYQRGLLEEQKFLRYDSALAIYSRGRGEAPQAPVTVQIARRADYLGSYFRLQRDIAEAESLLVAAAHPPVDTAAASIPDSLRRELPPPPNADSLRARLALKKSELAGLFYVGLGVNDSAEFWYRNVLREHPASPVVPRSIYSVAQIVGADPGRGKRESDSLYAVLLERYPETPFAAEAARLLGRQAPVRATDPVEARYWGAERALSTGNVEAAIDSFRAVARTGGTSPYVPRALYAMGLLYENLAPNIDSALANYRQLVARYPGSQFAVAARPKIDEVDAALRAAAARDSAAKTAERPAPSDSLATPPVRTPAPPPPQEQQEPPKMPPQEPVPPPLREVKPPEGDDKPPPLHRIR